MSLLTAIGAIGKGLKAGGEYDADVRERRMREEEAARRQQEFERENNERAKLRQSLYGVFEDDRAADGAETADMAREAGDAVGGIDPFSLGGAGTFLPFAATALKGAGDEVEKKTSTKSAFDPDVPYEQLVQIQDRQRDARARQTDRRSAQRTREQNAASLIEQRNQQNTDRIRARGDAEANRTMLRRLATAGTIDYTPEEIDGLSDRAVGVLAERSGTGNLSTRDANQRFTFRIENTPPRSSGGGADKDVLDGLARTRANDAFKRLPPDVRNQPEVQAWFSRLQEAESVSGLAAGRQAELLREGLKTIAPGANATRARGQRGPAPGLGMSDISSALTQQRQVIRDMWENAPPAVIAHLTGQAPAVATPPSAPRPTAAAPAVNPARNEARLARAREIMADPEATEEERKVAQEYLAAYGS